MKYENRRSRFICLSFESICLLPIHLASTKQMLSTEHQSQKAHSPRPQQATQAAEPQSSPSASRLAVQVATLQATSTLLPFIIQTHRALRHLLTIRIKNVTFNEKRKNEKAFL